MNGSNALSIINDLVNLVEHSFRVPLTSKIMVDEDEILDLLDRLKQYLPFEIEQARQIVNHRTNIVADAQKKAEKIVESAKQKSRHYAQETEIVKQAHEEAVELKKMASHDINQQRYGADKYSDEVLAALEEKVTRALTIVQNGRRVLSQSIETTHLHSDR